MKIKTVTYGKQIRKDLKLAVKRGYDKSKLDEVIDILCTTQLLPEKYKDYQLSGNYSSYRE